MDELIELRNDLNYSINVVDCFGSNDLLLLDRVTKLINALERESSDN